MKRVKLFALGLLSASTLFMTSCEEDDPADNEIAPTLTVTETRNGIISGSLEVTVGDSVTFQWDARKGSSDLDNFNIAINDVNVSATTDNGNNLPYDIENANDETYIDSYSFQANNEGTHNYTFEVTDKNGLNKVVEIEVVVAGQTNPLDGPQSFTWERVGSNPGTGLSQFGLKWTSNTATAAVITEDAATRMVQLQASDWLNITTKQDLEAAVENGTILTQYTGVSATASGTYDDVLGVRHNGEYYLILISQATVNSSGGGTTITISGLYNK